MPAATVDRQVDMLRLRGYLADVDDGLWVTPAQRQRAYAAAGRLSGLAGEDAPMTIDDLHGIMDSLDRAATDG